MPDEAKEKKLENRLSEFLSAHENSGLASKMHFLMTTHGTMLWLTYNQTMREKGGELWVDVKGGLRGFVVGGI